MNSNLTSVKQLAYRTVFIYAFFSSLWILLSDTVLGSMTHTSGFFTNIQTLKGWVFVLLTSGLIYALIRRNFHSLQESYNLLEAIIEGTTDAIFIKDIEGRYLMVNSTTAQLLGKPKSEILGKDDRDLFSLEAASQYQENDRAIIASGETQTIEEFGIINNIKRFYMATKYLCRDKSGKTIGLIGISRDITEIKQAAELLQETKEKLQAVVSAAPLAIFVTDRHNYVKMWNPAAERIFGWRETEVLNSPLPVIPPEKQEEFRTVRDRVFQGDSLVNLEAKAVKRNGSEIDISLSLAPLYDIDGQINSILSVIADISDAYGELRLRKRAEEERDRLIEELRQQTEDLTALNIVTSNSISTLKLEELLNVLLERIVKVMKADRVTILLPGEGEAATTLCVRASIGVEARIGDRSTIPIGEGFPGIIAATRKPLYVEDAQTDGRVCTEYIQDCGIRTMLGVPLKRYDTLVGVLHVDWCSIHPYSERELQLLEITAERCAMAILNAQLYQQTKELQERLQLQIERMPIGYIFTDPESRIQEWNPAAETIFGFSKEEVLGRHYEIVVPPEVRNEIGDIFQQLFQNEHTKQNVNDNLTKAGELITCDWQNTTIKKEDGAVIGVLSMVQNITLQQRAEKQLWKYAFYDQITDLPNQTLFIAWLKQFAVRSLLSDETNLFAVLYLDLSRFQLVKYSMGQKMAKELLLAVAERLQTCRAESEELKQSPKINSIAHVGANEFAILLENIQEERDAIAIVENIQHKLSAPFKLDGCEVFTDSSIGIVLSSINYQQPEELLQAAETAMNQSKLLGKSHYAVFHTSMQERAMRPLHLDADLRRALENKEFQVYYQPILSLVNHQIIGFEALVRWLHPDRGLVSPAEFIPLAEESSLIIPLGAWVLREATSQIMAWQQKFPTNPPLSISVNVSAVQLVQPCFIERIDRLLKETGINPLSLKLEITETAVMENAKSVTNVLEYLKERGIHLSIDDFGTGYSSFSYLHTFPFDTLKIDRAFVSRMSVDPKNLEIIRTIIILAHNLGMDLVAEGIETREQLNQLQELKCEHGQGYLFSRPVDSKAAERLLEMQLSSGA
ncbi:EAL domain-containing protein [Kamptonema animale CS-326]|jgi:PAS domain S-box-containing protein/diguanylate cyclase (GGDEF)-like protein|uniref:sensor domain-containing protein n=1 Tax=Kamptonema animale TaxID=92934 RepID=UPI00232EB3C6|nr:EAL domain-containing protein [Kamptonema animale]MDB9510500.1 EAL domain-containing protein [Kamptonema animale CS-326]